MSTDSNRGTPTEELSFAIRNALREERVPDKSTWALIADRLDSQEDTITQLNEELDAALEILRRSQVLVSDEMRQATAAPDAKYGL